MPGQLLQMGRVGRPHGIRGEIGLDWNGDYSPGPDELVYIKTEKGEPRPYRIASARRHKGRLLLALEGVPTRTEAEKLTGNLVYMDRANVPQPGEDEAFLADLPGSDVYLENGERLGRLDRLEFPAGQILWIIKDDAGREILFPAIPDFIRSLDPGAVTIAPPPGLLEIYRA